MRGKTLLLMVFAVVGVIALASGSDWVRPISQITQNIFLDENSTIWNITSIPSFQIRPNEDSPQTLNISSIIGVTSIEGYVKGGHTNISSGLFFNVSDGVGNVNFTGLGSCSAGESIRVINPDGSVVCEADSIGTDTIPYFKEVADGVIANYTESNDTRVVINGTTPNATLTLYGDFRIFGTLFVGQNTTKINQSGIQFDDDTFQDTAFVPPVAAGWNASDEGQTVLLNTSAQVGIGVQEANWTLDVNGTANFYGDLIPSENNSGSLGYEQRRWNQAYIEKLNVSELGGFSPIRLNAPLTGAVLINVSFLAGDGSNITGIKFNASSGTSIFPNITVVGNADFLQNITARNVTAEVYFGDGSQLTITGLVLNAFNTTDDITALGFALGEHTNLTLQDILDFGFVLGEHSNLTQDDIEAFGFVLGAFNDSANITAIVGGHTNLTEDDIEEFGFVKGAFNSSQNITDLGFFLGEHTNLTSDDILNFGFRLGEHTNLTSDDILNFGFVLGEHTNLTAEDIANFGFFNSVQNITDLGFVLGDHTNLTQDDIEAFGFVLGAFNDSANITAIVGDHTNLTEDDVEGFGFVKGAFNNSLNITSLGFVLGDHTNLTQDDIEAFGYVLGAFNDVDNITGLGFFLGEHTNLTQADIESFGFIVGAFNDVSNITDLGFFLGEHTNLTAEDIANFGFYNSVQNITDLGFVLGAHTNLTQDDIEGFGFVVGAFNSSDNLTGVFGDHTNLTEEDIEAFGFIKGAFNSSVNLTDLGFVLGEHTNLTLQDILDFGFRLGEHTNLTQDDIELFGFTVGAFNNSDNITAIIGDHTNLTQDDIEGFGFVLGAFNSTINITDLGFFLGEHTNLTEDDIEGFGYVKGAFNSTENITALGFVLGEHRVGDGDFLTNDSTTIYFNSSKMNSTIETLVADFTYWTPANNGMIPLLYNDTQNLRVGIGTSSPTGSLHVEGHLTPKTLNQTNESEIHFNFEEGTGEVAISNTNHKKILELNGDAHFADTLGTNNTKNWSVHFEDDGYAHVDEFDDLTLSDGYTVMFWFNKTATANQFLASKYTNETDMWAVQLKNDGKLYYLNEQAGSAVTRKTSENWNINEWHHFAVVQNGSGAGGVTIYHDGVVSSTVVGSVTFGGTNTDLYLGSDSAAANTLNGFMDEFMYFDDPLSGQDVNRIMNEGPKGSVVSSTDLHHDPVIVNRTSADEDENDELFFIGKNGWLGVKKVPSVPFDVAALAHFEKDVTFEQDVQIVGTLFGGSPVKIRGGLNVEGDSNITAGRLITDNLQVMGNLTGGSPLKVGGGITITDDNTSTDHATLKLVSADEGAAKIMFVQGGDRKWTQRVGTNELMEFTSRVSQDVIMAMTHEGYIGLGLNNRNPTSTLDVDGTVRFRRDDFTIDSTGSIVYNQTFSRVDTFASAATDDLDSITGGEIGDQIILMTNSNTRDVTLRDGTGNLALAGDFTLDNTRDKIVLIKSGGNRWDELSRSDNQ